MEHLVLDMVLLHTLHIRLQAPVVMEVPLMDRTEELEHTVAGVEEEPDHCLRRRLAVVETAETALSFSCIGETLT